MSDFDPKMLKLAGAEHTAWSTFVAEWREAGLPDMNGTDMTPVIRAVELWGEYLVALREYQEPAVRVTALADKTVAYVHARREAS